MSTTTRIDDAEIREYLAVLNAHTDRHQSNPPSCDCDAYRDVTVLARTVPGYDPVRSAARFTRFDLAFVLTDGTELTADNRGHWSAARPTSEATAT